MVAVATQQDEVSVPVRRLVSEAIKNVKAHHAHVAQQFAELQREAAEAAIEGCAATLKADEFLGPRLLNAPSYISSRAKHYLDLARASYSSAGTHDGKTWDDVNLQSAASLHNLRVVGKVVRDGERSRFTPAPPATARVVELCFRGSIFAGHEGGINLDNWCRLNFSPGVSLAWMASSAAWSYDRMELHLTPIDESIGGSHACLHGVHVHAGFQLGYLAARAPILAWLDEQRQSPEQPLHVCCVGHSLGAALATLLALDLGMIGRDVVELITWASPRVGDQAFCTAFSNVVHAVARFTCGADVVPYVPPEALGFQHVCPETRLDAWVTKVADGLGSHSLDVHAINLENCFRDPLKVVRFVEGGWRLTAAYAPFALMAVQGCSLAGVLPAEAGVIAGWLSANDTVAKQLDRAVDQLQLQVRALQSSVDAIMDGVQAALDDQDAKVTLREVRAQLNALVENTALEGEEIDCKTLRQAQQRLLLLGKDIWSIRDARMKYGPQLLDVLLTSYAAELKLLLELRPQQAPTRKAQIDATIRGLFPAVKEAWENGLFAWEQCPALDCLLPQLVLGEPLALPLRAATTSAPEVAEAPRQVAPPTFTQEQITAFLRRREFGIWGWFTAPAERRRQLAKCHGPKLPWNDRLQVEEAPILLHLIRTEMPELQTLNLEGFSLAIKQLTGAEPVESIDLSNRNLGDLSAVVLAGLIQRNEVLTDLNLSYNDIHHEGAKAMAEMLQKNTGVLTITLDGEALPVKQLKGTEPVESIDLSKRNLGEGLGYLSGIVIAKLIEGNTTLTTLCLGNNNLGTEAGKTLADALKVNTALTDLRLYNTRLSKDAGKALADALLVNNTLKSLDLVNNGTYGIGLGGAAIAEALKDNTALTSLHLAATALDTKAGKALAEALLVNTTLKELDLRTNVELLGCDVLWDAVKGRLGQVSPSFSLARRVLHFET